MPRRTRTLNGRANQAGILFVAANAPLTFERTLMPRGTMDQALVTGLSAAANHALIALVQESIQAAALVVSGQGRHAPIDDRRWSRATIATDLAAIGVGIAMPTRPEPAAPRAAPAPWRADRAASGCRSRGPRAVSPGILHEVVDTKGRRSFAVNVVGRGRARGRQHVARAQACPARRGPSRPKRRTRRSRSRLGIGLGVVAGMSAFGAGERRFADVVSRTLARVLPGDAAIWRPVASRRHARGLRRGRALHRGHRPAPDRGRERVGRGRVRHPAAEPVRERERREPRPVRLAVARRARGTCGPRPAPEMHRAR